MQEMGTLPKKTDSVNAEEESRKEPCNNVFSVFNTYT